MDLVAQIHEKERQAEAQAAADKKAKARNTMIKIIIALVLLAIAGYAGFAFFQSTTYKGGLEEAREKVAVGNASDVTEGLEAISGHPAGHHPTEALAALIVAEGVIVGTHTPDELSAAVSTAQGSVGGGGIHLKVVGVFEGGKAKDQAAADLAAAKGILAMVTGEAFDAAGTENATAGFATPFLILNGTDYVASRDGASMPEGAGAVGQAAGAMLEFRGGDAKLALDHVTEARQTYPAHMGLQLEEVLFCSLLGSCSASDADGLAALLLSGELGELGPYWTTRAHLVRAAAKAHDEEMEEARKHLADAAAAVPTWDRSDAELIAELGLQIGALDPLDPMMERLGKTMEPEKPIYDAWKFLADDDPKAALKATAELDQSDPRVSAVQAFALVDAGRGKEAGPWLERANLGSLLASVHVARIRADHQAQPKPEPPAPDPKADPKAEPPKAPKDEAPVDKWLEEIDTIEDETPWAYRVYTVEGILHVRKGDKDSAGKAKKAFKRAIDREYKPAIAAKALADVDRDAAGTSDKKRDAILELYKNAAEWAPNQTMYTIAYATYLAELGNTSKAFDLLEPVAGEADIGPAPRLLAADLAMLEANRKNEAPAADVRKWIETAASEQAMWVDTKRRFITYDTLAAGEDKTKLATVAAEGRTAVSQLPKEVELRLAASEPFRRMRDKDSAESIIRGGLSKAPEARRGILQVKLAQLTGVGSKAKKRRASGQAWTGWKALLLDPDTAAWDVLWAGDFTSDLWMDLANESGALAVARDLTKRLPKSARAWVVRGNIQLRTDNTKYACESAKTATELDDKLASAWALQGACDAASKRSDEAKKAYDKAIELAKGTGEETKFRRALKKID